MKPSPHVDQFRHWAQPSLSLISTSIQHSYHSQASYCSRMLEEEEELNDETIQARVDASLAKIYSVTSTWLKPKKTRSAPNKDFEKELEGIMRRPPR